MAFLLLAAAGCKGTPPPSPDAGTAQWRTYTNPLLRYSMEYPDAYILETDGDGSGARFRHDGYPCIS